VCDTLPPGDLTELDLVLADPLRWPVTIWGAFAPPEGDLPISYRRLGAMRMGHAWLDEHGWSGQFADGQLRRHLRYDVPVLSVDVNELITRGLIGETTAGNSKPGHTSEAIDPLSYIRLYNKGIALGLSAMTLLEQKVNKLIEEKEPVPLPLVKMILDAGMRLATSQAHIKSAGRKFGNEELDENDAFMGGAEISPRLGHHRVRMIEGKMRPVVDEGMADRAAYNERAAMEGSPRIGGR
jgi:hypothetical protein